MTSSAAKIGAPVRTARASASDGRESTSSSRPFCRQGDRGEERVVAQLGDRDLRALDVELAEHVVHEVVRHRPRRAGALQLHQDRRRLRMPDPDGQELVRVDGLQQDDRLLADHVEGHAVDHHLLHPSKHSPPGWLSDPLQRPSVIPSRRGAVAIARASAGARTPSSSACSVRSSAARTACAPAQRSGSGGIHPLVGSTTGSDGQRVAAVECEGREDPSDEVRRVRRRCRCSPRRHGPVRPGSRRSTAAARA